MTSLRVLKPHRIDLTVIAGATTSDPTDSQDAYARVVQECIDGWVEVSGRRADQDAAQILKLTRKSRVIRLPGAGPDSSSVIGKRRLRQASVAEGIVLGGLAPSLPVSMIRLHGSLERDGFMWHYLEDGGTIHFDSSDPSHVTALVEWLCELHDALRGSRPNGLPDHSTDQYLAYLRATHARLEKGLRNEVSSPEQRSELRDIGHLLDELVTAWATLVEAVSVFPDTLVHGDLQAKNIMMRGRANEVSVLAIDWETSGWGTPAADIALLARSTGGLKLLYQHRQSVFGRGVSTSAWTRAVAVGRVFRLLAAMDWASYDQLEWSSVRKPIKRLTSYGSSIREVLAAAGLRVVSPP